jgi:hypothetical protein
MVTLTFKVVVPAPVAQTAAFVLNLSNDRTWRSEVISMELDPPGPVQVGQRIVDRMRFGVLPFTVRAEAVEVDPTSFTLRAQGPQMTMRIHRSVAPHPDGAEVTAEVTVQPHGLLRLLSPLMTVVFRRGLGANVARIPAAIAPTSHGHQQPGHRRGAQHPPPS